MLRNLKVLAPLWCSSGSTWQIPMQRAGQATTGNAPGAGGRRSFIEVADKEGMVGLVGRSFPSKGGYDANFSGALVLRSFEKGDRSGGIPASAIADVEITPSLTNAYSTLHGGAIATLVDVLGTLALLAEDPSKPGVSVEINVSYLSAAKVGTHIVAEGTVLRSGRSLGYTEVRLHDTTTKKLVAIGRHTKAFPRT
eukprot:m.70349 g.70349  ORF g.70349 m.70349 type:complete len:196 (-) comp18501_c0_seq3:1409-1996(-)